MEGKITKIWLANKEGNYLIVIGWDVSSCQLEQNIQSIHNKDSLMINKVLYRKYMSYHTLDFSSDLTDLLEIYE